MSALHYAVSMACPKATKPTVLWTINCSDEVISGWPGLWVPRLETWTLDTLRMVLHVLAAYLPPHDDAQVTIHAKTNKPTGRVIPGRPPRPRRFNERVVFELVARGWTVNVCTYRNEVENEKGERDRVWNTGAWTEPMQAVLLDLAAKSPFSLAAVMPVESGDPRALGLSFASRRAVVTGVEPKRVIVGSLTRYQRLMKRVLDACEESDDDAAA